MSDRHVRSSPGEEPGAEMPRTRHRLPLRIAESYRLRWGEGEAT
jgi:hypothetical protein